ncbi:MAG: efflux RND transporter permease subunit [Gammaproteobacteria bacterium]|nr:efflux RND transporter permease subunit [Gammaproteobacteria bacterium]
MKFTDLYIKRPVLATVVSLLILVLGLRSMFSLPILQFPRTENAVVTVTTTYVGADTDVIAGFITTPLENSIAQANGIDYLTSTSQLGRSTIQAYLNLNYDSNKALSEINTKVNAVLNQLPNNSQVPVISVDIGQTIDAMYMSFYSDFLPRNKVTDYLVRVVQPKLQAVNGVQVAEILGGRQIALRVWLDPAKLSAYQITAADISTALATNDIVSAIGRTHGQMMTVNLSAKTDLNSVEEFQNLIVKSQNGAIVRLRDVGEVSLGAQNYDTNVQFNNTSSVYIGIKVAPSANLLNVIADIREIFPDIVRNLPSGIEGKIVYDSTKFINSSIHEVVKSLLEALIIVTIVIFLFLGSVRSVIIPVLAIPLSLIGAFLIMEILHYSTNLLTLLSLVLAIGLVVDDAIIVVENVQRHMENGLSRMEAAILGARELANPIIAISIVLIAVFIPIGFMGGLTGALFTEFAFTLAGAVAISAIVALTLSPMMCSRFLSQINHNSRFHDSINRHFDNLHNSYKKHLHHSLNYLPVTAVFAAIIFLSIGYLYSTSKSELAPQEDQGVVISQLTTSPNATIDQTQLYADQIYKIYRSFPETDAVFALIGASGLNSAINGMILKPWDERDRTSNQIQPLVQEQLDKISGGKAAAFQLPSLPGARGLPIQFVLQTTESFDQLNEVAHDVMNQAMATGLFMFMDSDLKIDKAQSNLLIDRDKASQLGFTMQDIATALGSALGGNYINYFNFSGRSYQVIPQVSRNDRLNDSQLLNYYLTSANGTSIPLSTIAQVKTVVVPESLNHFQQINSATISAVAAPGVAMGTALDALKNSAEPLLPQGYTYDYAAQSRQFKQEGTAFLITFFFAMIIIFLSLAALFESFRDPLTVLISVPMSICGALVFVSLGIGGATLNIYTQVGLVTLIGLISKHGILIVQFANDLQKTGKTKREAIEMAASIRLRPILMTTTAMVVGVFPLIFASGAGALSRFSIGLVIASGISIGTLFTLFVVPAMYMFLAEKHTPETAAEPQKA